MILIIAEKPRLARNIAQAVGANAKREGYLEGAGYCVTWAFGHLFSLCDVEEYTGGERGGKWTMENLPCFPEHFRFRLRENEQKEVDPGVLRQFECIKSLLAREDLEKVVNAGDADREGEIPDSAPVGIEVEIGHAVRREFLMVGMIDAPDAESAQHDVAVFRIVRIEVGEQDRVIPAAQFARFHRLPQQAAAPVALHIVEFRPVDILPRESGQQPSDIFRQVQQMPLLAFQFFRREDRGVQRRRLGLFRDILRWDQLEVIAVPSGQAGGVKVDFAAEMQTGPEPDGGFDQQIISGRDHDFAADIFGHPPEHDRGRQFPAVKVPQEFLGRIQQFFRLAVQIDVLVGQDGSVFADDRPGRFGFRFLDEIGRAHV